MANRVDLSRLRKKIAVLSDEMKTELQAVNEKSADQLVNLVKQNIPLGPPERGHLRDTVRKEPGRHELSIKVTEGDPLHPYAAPLEFGHMDDGHHVPPTPHFFPAVRVVRKTHKGRARRAVNKIIKKLGGGK